jgi:hypothetical protein
MIGVDEPNRLLTEHLLLKMTMKESIRDVHLVHQPPARDRELKNCADGAGFNNGCKGVMEVDSFALPETTDHPTSLVMIECTIRMKLVLEDPLPGDDIGLRWSGNKLPRFVAM